DSRAFPTRRATDLGGDRPVGVHRDHPCGVGNHRVGLRTRPAGGHRDPSGGRGGPVGGVREGPGEGRSLREVVGRRGARGAGNRPEGVGEGWDGGPAEARRRVAGGRKAAVRGASRPGTRGGAVLWGAVDSRVRVVAAPNTVAGRVWVTAARSAAAAPVRATAGPKRAGPIAGRTGADGGGPAEGPRHYPGVLRVRAGPPAPRHVARPRVRPAFVPRPVAGRVPPRPCVWPRRAAPCVLRKGRPTPP